MITGAAEGIGRAIAELFHAEGARVVATDIRLEPFEVGPCGFETARLDVTSATDVRELARRYPDTGVLVNCAGFVAVGNALECSAEDFATSIQVNVQSIRHTVQAFLPGMRERGNGSIINIASVVSTTLAMPRRFVYAATKAAVIAMTRSIALDFVRDGVRCNSISPGTTDTPSLAGRFDATGDPQAARDAVLRLQPLGRMARPDEIAAVAVMLASSESSFMTGADIVVDGGISL